MRDIIFAAGGVIIGLVIHFLLSLHPVTIGPMTLTLNPLPWRVYALLIVALTCVIVIADAWEDNFR